MIIDTDDMMGCEKCGVVFEKSFCRQRPTQLYSHIDIFVCPLGHINEVEWK
jgi:hypothetical protein